jgi:hypothetical protein
MRACDKLMGTRRRDIKTVAAAVTKSIAYGTALNIFDYGYTGEHWNAEFARNTKMSKAHNLNEFETFDEREARTASLIKRVYGSIAKYVKQNIESDELLGRMS